MPTLSVSLENGQMWRTPCQLVVRVDGINFAVPNKSLRVSVDGPFTLYSWIDFTISPQQGVTQDTVIGSDYLLATITMDAPPPVGTVLNFDITYSDNATPELTATPQVCVGNVVVLARSPAPAQLDVPVIAPIVLAARADAGLEFARCDLFLNGTPVNDAQGAFLRPDFSGSTTIANGTLAVKVHPRRAFDEGAPVTVRWDLRVTPDNERRFLARQEWVFNTARRVTKLLDPTLQRTALDLPSPIGVIEIFRQTALDALVPQRSTASSSVVFYYVVQQSSLASLAPGLPGAVVLAPETSRLLPSDIASPTEAAAKLAAAGIFWTSLLQVLVRDAHVPPPVTELLDRAWNSEYPADKGGAVAAALLYAVQGSL